MKQIDDHAAEWRCLRCRTLLGILGGKRIEIKYKSARYTIHARGPAMVTAECRYCGTSNVVHAGTLDGGADAAD